MVLHNMLSLYAVLFIIIFCQNNPGLRIPVLVSQEKIITYVVFNFHLFSRLPCDFRCAGEGGTEQVADMYFFNVHYK